MNKEAFFKGFEDSINKQANISPITLFEAFKMQNDAKEILKDYNKEAAGSWWDPTKYITDYGSKLVDQSIKKSKTYKDLKPMIDIGGKVSNFLNNAYNKVKENPYTSAGIATAIGLPLIYSMFGGGGGGGFYPPMYQPPMYQQPPPQASMPSYQQQAQQGFQYRSI